MINLLTSDRTLATSISLSSFIIPQACEGGEAQEQYEQIKNEDGDRVTEIPDELIHKAETFASR